MKFSSLISRLKIQVYERFENLKNFFLDFKIKTKQNFEDFLPGCRAVR